MLTLEARIPTDQPGRYLRQFCKHAEAMNSPRAHRMRMHGGNPLATGEVRLRLDWTDTLATVHFDPWGQCVLRAEPDALHVRIDATDNTALQRIRDTVSRDLERFGRGQFTIGWLSDNETANPSLLEPPVKAHLRGVARRGSLLALVALVLVLAVHLGLAGYAVSHWRWSLSALGLAAGALAAKVLLIGGFRAVHVRRQRSVPQVTNETA